MYIQRVYYNLLTFSFLFQIFLWWSSGPTLAQVPPTPNITHAPGLCLWYKQCGDSGTGKYNCFYNGPAVNVTQGSNFSKALKAICPQYADGPVCCDQNQLDTLLGQIRVPRQLFSRCPACLKNFIDHFCAITCDPNSAQYMNGTLGWNPDLKKFEVRDATIYLTDTYGQELFDSCKNVRNPSDNAGKVIDLMCGRASPCTRDAWFKYFGTRNPYVPFRIHYVFGDNTTDGIVPNNASFYPCNYHNGSDYSLQCSCPDCKKSLCLCPPSSLPPKDTFPLKKITIIVSSVFGVLVLILFLVALIAGIIQLYQSSNRGYTATSNANGRSQYDTVEDEKNEYPTSSVGSINDVDIDINTRDNDNKVCCCVAYSKMGAYFERWIKRVFYLWGKFTSRFWYLVIIGMVLIVIALSFGMFFFKLTTDPVKLWSSPNSRARQEKNYFDTNFNPFYRTEMIIVKPLNQTKEAYFEKHVPLGTGDLTWTFGPALQFNVMNEVCLQVNSVLSLIYIHAQSI